MNNDAATGGALMPAESARFLAAADALLNDEADALGFLLLPDWRKPSADPSQRAAGELWEALLRAQVVHQNREREGIDYQTSRDRACAEVVAALTRAVACPDPGLALRVVAAVTVMGWDIEAGTIRRGHALQAELVREAEKPARNGSKGGRANADKHARMRDKAIELYRTGPAGRERPKVAARVILASGELRRWCDAQTPSAWTLASDGVQSDSQVETLARWFREHNAARKAGASSS